MHDVLKYEDLIKEGSLGTTNPMTYSRIDTRLSKTSDYRTSIVNDKVFQVMMNNRSRMIYPCTLISMLFGIDLDSLIKNVQYYKEFIDRSNMRVKGEIADCMLVYENTLFSIEMNGSNTLLRNQDYVHRASTIKLTWITLT